MNENGAHGHGHCGGASSAAAGLHELVEGVHAWIQPDGTWWINNAGAVIGSDQTMVIDTCATEERTRRFLAAVGEVAGGRPIRLAVNTHDHGDHTTATACSRPTPSWSVTRAPGGEC